MARKAKNIKPGDRPGEKSGIHRKGASGKEGNGGPPAALSEVLVGVMPVEKEKPGSIPKTKDSEKQESVEEKLRRIKKLAAELKDTVKYYGSDPGIESKPETKIKELKNNLLQLGTHQEAIDRIMEAGTNERKDLKG